MTGRWAARVAGLWVAGLWVTFVARAAAFDVSTVGLNFEGETAEDKKLYYYVDGMRISPWHDIPFLGREGQHGPTLNFICEIPKGTRAKFEIHKSEPHNPVIQDRKKGKLRFYAYSASTVNYGAIAQTWEDPNIPHPDTGFGGDNDPIDVLQINEEPCVQGEVMPVRVLGTLALIDDDETDWKLIVVRDDILPDNLEDVAPETLAMHNLRDIKDVDAEKVSELREWFRMYKTAEGKGENKFGLNEQAMDAAYALTVAHEAHHAWRDLVGGKAKCEFNGNPCWTPPINDQDL